MRIGNLENCKIYKVVSLNNHKLVYYGHTSQILAQRFTTHRSKANKLKNTGGPGLFQWLEEPWLEEILVKLEIIFQMN